MAERRRDIMMVYHLHLIMLSGEDDTANVSFSSLVPLLSVIIKPPCYLLHQDSLNLLAILPPGLQGAPPIQYSSLTGPHFASNGTTAKVLEGSTAVLTCSVRNLRNYTVNFISEIVMF